MRTNSRQTPPPYRAKQKEICEPQPEELIREQDEPTRPIPSGVLTKADESLQGDTQPVDDISDIPASGEELQPQEDDLQQPREGRRNRRSNVSRAPQRRFSKTVMALAVMLGVLLVMGTCLFAYASKLLGGLQYDQNASLSGYADDTPDPNDLGTPDPNETLLDEAALESALPAQTAAPIAQGKSTYNILLLGLDTRNASSFDSARSDVMMLVTLDTEKKTIKLTSFMRDIIIAIPGHNRNRLNTAFAFGGPDLAKQMLTQYFGVKIDNYGIINFWAFASVIDALGGVTVDVKPAELANLNKNIDEINGLSKKKTAHVRSGGAQKLTGAQAIGYMRIRHGDVGGGDFERTQRQRTVMTNLTQKLKSISPLQAVELVNKLQPYVRTDMTTTQMADVATKLLSIGGAQVQQLRVPIDGAYRMGSVANVGMGVLLLDFPKNVTALQQFLEN